MSLFLVSALRGGAGASASTETTPPSTTSSVSTSGAESHAGTRASTGDPAGGTSRLVAALALATGVGSEPGVGAEALGGAPPEVAAEAAVAEGAVLGAGAVVPGAGFVEAGPVAAWGVAGAPLTVNSAAAGAARAVVGAGAVVAAGAAGAADAGSAGAPGAGPVTTGAVFGAAAVGPTAGAVPPRRSPDGPAACKPGLPAASAVQPGGSCWPLQAMSSMMNFTTGDSLAFDQTPFPASKMTVSGRMSPRRTRSASAAAQGTASSDPSSRRIRYCGIEGALIAYPRKRRDPDCTLRPSGGCA